MPSRKSMSKISWGLVVLGSSLPVTAQGATVPMELSALDQNILDDINVVSDDAASNNTSEESVSSLPIVPESLIEPRFSYSDSQNVSRSKPSTTAELENSLIAQILPDTTLGSETSIVTPNVAINGDSADQIEGGAVRGANLFHSFQEFNVNSGQRVYFSTHSGIQNILSRITGENVSNIDGLLGVDGSANLYLLNPNGIVFGPNAELDIRGSFVASTAESIEFGNGIEFSATNPENAPLLSISVTPGLQYGNHTTSITTAEDSNLQVEQNLILGAQRLDLAGQLKSGRDIILQGEERLLSNARYTTGGYLFTQDLSGETIDFLIPHERVITANGDFQLNSNYDDQSLYIMAGGQVTHEAANNIIFIREERVREASGSSITQEIDDGIGGRQSITVNSSNEPIVDIRSGIDWDQWGGVRGNTPTGLGSFGNEVDPNAVTGKGINLGFIQIEKGGGAITLIAQGNGDIQTGSLNTRSNSNGSGDIIGGDGGNIILSTKGNINISHTFDPITASGIDAGSDTTSTTGNAIGGNGGDIIFLAGGNIDIDFATSLDKISSRANAGSESNSQGSLQVGEAGDITLSAGGNINIPVGYLQASSFSVLGPRDSENVEVTNENIIKSSTSGYGGNINLLAGGSINIPDGLHTLSRVTVQQDVSNLDSLIGAEGGEISVDAVGDISVGELVSNAFLLSLSTQSRVNIDQGGNAGNIYMKADGDIQTGNIEAESLSRVGAGGFIQGGDGGDVSIEANGDIQTGVLRSYSYLTSNLPNESSNTGLDNVIGGNGGDITLLAGRNISTTDFNSFGNFNSFSLALSDAGDVIAGNGGDIYLSAQTGGIQAQPVNNSARLYSFSFGEQTEGGMGGNGGDIRLEAATYINGLEILTFSPSAKSGNIQIDGLQDLDVIDTNIIASKQLTIEIPSPPEGTSRITIPIGGQGQSGDAILTGLGNLTFTNSSFLNNTNSSDPAGEIIIRSPEWIIFDNSSINSSTNDAGQAGNINIDAGRGVRFTGADTQLQAQTNAKGDAGNIEIQAPQIIAEQAAQISTATSNQGRAGNITLNTDVLSLNDGGEIRASTSGSGNSGTITVNASSAVNLGEGVQNFEPIISVVTSDAGRAGNIIINTPDFTLSETARVTATATTTATNSEGGGSITLNADQMDLAGTVGIFAETEGQSPGGELTLQPYENNPDLDVTLAPGAKISASTSGTGQGGSLRVLAPESVIISGPGQLAVETIGPGQAGNIAITSQQLFLSDGVTISASTRGSGKAGNITLTGQNITLNEGAQINSNTNSSGAAGDIEITATEGISIQGVTSEAENSGIFARTLSDGRGGNISLNTPQVTLSDTAEITAATTNSSRGGNLTVQNTSPIRIKGAGRLSVESQGANSGRSGDLDVIAPSAVLDDGVIISASTESQQGGGIITFDIHDVLLLRRGSLINAEATNATGGTAGNIDIDAGFVVAVPNENSDIIANANGGNGGRIDITTNQIFGFEEQSEVRFTTSELRDNTSSDLSASSQSGQQGIIAISTLAPDPNQGLTELLLISPAPPIQQGCSAASIGNSSFTVTGRGGLPPGPASELNIERPLADLGPDVLPPDTSVSSLSDVSIPKPSTQILEAQGWITDSDGQTTFVAHTPNTTFDNDQHPSIQCSGSVVTDL
ncbi:filamentous hemagglutinin N-terminal domain-containing protein [Adonisia turfae]|uniref:Filamentous hemagglutinin N-terminal domain-containing protein n=1 Tax=Adonisia turfae CCMR0081 TaxID=2292702 RepID=A0A6M0RVV7_9CYAN|nr:filamentous hemagglutinin N-terminal domain-containing protein [Adonisia turfae]NEZ60000.1 filamentous hemagglutinin N-terminal domain-containing protein [Adonisia turfae CCMR0081]